MKNYRHCVCVSVWVWFIWVLGNRGRKTPTSVRSLWRRSCCRNPNCRHWSQLMSIVIHILYNDFRRHTVVLISSGAQVGKLSLITVWFSEAKSQRDDDLARWFWNGVILETVISRCCNTHNLDHAAVWMGSWLDLTPSWRRQLFISPKMKWNWNCGRLAYRLSANIQTLTYIRTICTLWIHGYLLETRSKN